MSKIALNVPDIGADQAEVVEILVAVGDTIEPEQSLIVLESDKASMEVPAEAGGVVVSIALSVGDEVSQGAEILTLEVAAADADQAAVAETESGAPAKETEGGATAVDKTGGQNAGDLHTADDASAAELSGGKTTAICVPDIGGGSAEVVEILVAEGDDITLEQGLVVLESDKASMEVPASVAGVVNRVAVMVGDSLSAGDLVVEVTSRADTPPAATETTDTSRDSGAQDAKATTGVTASQSSGSTPTSGQDVKSSNLAAESGDGGVYAGPAVRKLAREFGVDLQGVAGSGPRGRISKEDLQQYVAKRLAEPTRGGAADHGIPPIPEVDYAQFGDIDQQPRSRMDKLTAVNMSRAWLNVPHVTQFDDADITELETFRKSLKSEAEKRGTKLSPLPFVLKACAVALNLHPKLKASLAEGGDLLVHKDYCHIGMAVDTPAGLVVPVLRDVDKKSIWQISEEVIELAGLARDRKLRPEQMAGGVFSVSSLGGIGGRGFTPVVNAPEVAILGVSRASIQPVWDGEQFAPRMMLPLSLSYDHRVINGGDAGRFMTQLVALLGDIRHCLL